MRTQTAMAAGSVLVALALSLSTWERWRARRRRHELAWTVALWMATIASSALWWGAATGWSGPAFRVFYLFGAIADVPVLALGTVYLLAGPRRGDRSAAAVSLLVAFAAGVVLAAPLRHPVPAHRLPQGSQVFGPLPRVLAAVASAGGALVVLAGAAWSARRLRGARMWGNVLIAVGTLVLGSSGLLNSVLGEMSAFAATLALGLALIFVGFLTATTASISTETSSAVS